MPIAIAAQSDPVLLAILDCALDAEFGILVDSRDAPRMRQKLYLVRRAQMERYGDLQMKLVTSPEGNLLVFKASQVTYSETRRAAKPRGASALDDLDF